MTMMPTVPAVTKLRTAILGASGYTGAELLRYAYQHPTIEVAALTADRHAGKPAAHVFPHLGHRDLPDLVRIEDVNFAEMDVVFCALPHATSQAVIKKLPGHVRVIDLSADFRLTNMQAYETWYGKPHDAPEMQGEAVYGLTEFHRAAIRMARLVAVPGCHPTVGLLCLLPLVMRRLIDPDVMIVDSKTGVTGAGRSEKLGNLFAEVAEGMHGYALGAHRHMAEFEQELSAAAGSPIRVSFTPHLIPINRGMLATCYLRMADGEDLTSLRDGLEEAYENEPFVRVLPEGVTPATRSVRGTNMCHINIFADRRPGWAIVIGVIDNLTKGASGQAVQNFNVMTGIDETTGLLEAPLFP